MGPACMRDLLEEGVSQGKKHSHSFIYFLKCSWGRIRQSSPCLWGQPTGLFSALVSPQRTKKKGPEAQTIACPGGPPRELALCHVGPVGKGQPPGHPFLTPTQSCLPAPGRDWLVTVNRKGLFCLGMDERLLASCISFPDGHTGPHAAHPPPRESAHCL